MVRSSLLPALLAIAIVCAACERTAPDTRPQELRAQLTSMRTAIRSFHRDHGRYPHSLEELVPKYLPSVPVDPMTGTNTTWRLTTEEIVPQNADFTTAATQTQSYVLDVHSGAGGEPSNW